PRRVHGFVRSAEPRCDLGTREELIAWQRRTTDTPQRLDRPMPVTVDKKVPAFSCVATGNKKWKLSDAAGKKLVVYFYPKDNTPGCTTEGAAFRDLYPAFKKAGTIVVGVSPDSLASHEKFKAKM